MSVAQRASALLFHPAFAVLLIVAGVVGGIVSYRSGRQDEWARAEVEFSRRASVRHALAREIFGRYEDSLFGLSALFMLDTTVTRAQFTHATARLEQRSIGAQAFEWVPLVPHESRASMEAALQRAYPRRHFEFVHFDTQGRAVRAPDRPVYWPISFVQPLLGNETALGYDLMTAPTVPFLELARDTRQMVVTSQVKLVQETDNQLGVVMICPVYRVPRATMPTDPLSPPAANPPPGGFQATPPGLPPAEVFIGFLQVVFRVHDLLETARAPQTETVLDMLFVDDSETDPVKRLLYYRPALDKAPRSPFPSQDTFRTGMSREHQLPFGQRDWRVIYRPRAGWIEEQRTTTPFLRSCSLVLLSALIAGLIQIVGRQTGTVQRQVDERTRELADSRRQLSNLLHALPGMAYRCRYDERFNVLFVSEGARELTGWTAEEFLSGAVHFRDLIHPDDLERVREATRTAVHEQTDTDVEYRIRTRNGAEKWVLARGRGVSDGNQTNLFEGLAIDVTTQKQAEIARLTFERKLLEGQKLESLGLLAGGIAHDFNNLLSSILGNASLTRLTLTPDSPTDKQVAAIETASLRAAELCRQMLAYAGKGRFVVEPTDLTTLTEDLLPLLRISIARQASLDLRLTRELPAIMADATQLRQIVMNFVLNAADAIGERGGSIAISTGVTMADAAFLNRCVAGAGLPAGEYVFLEVEDTGCGMPPEVLAKIFDPFFTTKFAGRGLGLAAALGIVRGHYGALQVESTPGKGSRFRLLLPPTKGMVAPPKTIIAASSQRWRHSGQVLVIEDEEPVRAITGEILKSFGLTASAASNGTEGVTLFRETPDRFDLVICDLLMPGLNGEQTLAAIRQIRPQARVLLISGYSEGDILRRLGGGGPLAFLSKPFTRDALEKKLRALLDMPKATSATA